MPDESIIFGAAALPEPDRAWLAAVERLPIASVWQGGHVLPRQASGEAVTRLSLMTAWTERVRVGTAVLMLPLYHPVLAAKQLADLDAWSGGRVSVGVGVGGEFPHEFEAMGVPVRERGARTDEAMTVLRALWQREPVTHHGRFFDLDKVELHPVAPPGADPSPGRAGGPPLLVSGRKEPAMRRAARLGDGWMPYLLSPNAYARSVRTIRDEADTAGRDLAGFEWALYLYCSVRRDGDRARDEVAAFLGGAYGGKPDAMLQRIAPAGTPEEVAARIQEYVDAGARHVIISPAAHDDTLGIVRLAAEEVLPRLSVPAEKR
ncbi:LLM class flavin-dependent oxidoreductase [Yinghuangia sp. YIM S10712]|uniref:LLM class flavin-dependent oxidoreductase n=1 Tax=Yinghuangia sp. YIM S10712 TaxID=3436930 RepID=UPI003F52DA62